MVKASRRVRSTGVAAIAARRSRAACWPRPTRSLQSPPAGNRDACRGPLQSWESSSWSDPSSRGLCLVWRAIAAGGPRTSPRTPRKDPPGTEAGEARPSRSARRRFAGGSGMRPWCLLAQPCTPMRTTVSASVANPRKKCMHTCRIRDNVGCCSGPPTAPRVWGSYRDQIGHAVVHPVPHRDPGSRVVAAELPGEDHERPPNDPAPDTDQEIPGLG